MQPQNTPYPSHEPYPQLPEEESIDFRKYLFLILSNWYWFAITITIGVGTAYLINRYSSDVYQLNASLIVGEDKGSNSLDNILNELTPIRRMNRRAVVDNELSILKSYSMARKAVEELDFEFSYYAVGRRKIVTSPLYQNAPFLILSDTIDAFPAGTPLYITPGKNQSFQYRVGDEEKFETGIFGDTIQRPGWKCVIVPRTDTINAAAGREYYVVRNTINGLAKQYRARLNVAVNADKGSIVSLSMQGLESQRVADYLNTLMDVYIRTDLEEKNQAATNSIAFIDEQLQNIVDTLDMVGLQLQQFRSDNRAVNLSQEGQMLFEQLKELQNQQAQLEIQNDYYAYLLTYITEKKEQGDIIAPSVVGIGDPLLNNLVQQINALYIQKQELAYTMQPGSPAIQTVNEQMEDLRASLEENVRGLVRNNERVLKSTRQRLQGAERQLAALPATERQLINIQREFDINNEIYTFLLQKRAEAGITKASSTSDHAVLDKAMAENATMVKPKKQQNYMMGFLIGFLIPLVIIFLRDFLDNTIHGRHDIERLTSTPLLGSIGHNMLESEIPVNEKPRSSLAESFRAIRTNLQYMLKEEDKVVLITSTMSGEGKTFCALNLATMLAVTGKKTLLLGLDLRKPHMHKVFNLENDTGISTYLIGRSTYEELLVETNIANLWVAPSGPKPPNPAELLGRPDMQALLAKARQEFDYIFIDTPPVGIVADGLEMAPMVDSLLFVVRQDYSPKDVIKLVEELRGRNDIKNMAVMLNDVKLKGHYGNAYRYNYGYGYHYAYGYAHGYYEEDVPQLKIHERVMKWITGFRK